MDHQILSANGSNQSFLIYGFIVMTVRWSTITLGGDLVLLCVFLPNHAVTVMLNRTEPYVPEGGAYLPEREPFIVPVEPERTAEEYEDYGAEIGRAHV